MLEHTNLKPLDIDMSITKKRKPMSNHTIKHKKSMQLLLSELYHQSCDENLYRPCACMGIEQSIGANQSMLIKH